jgi:hypothetical protein
VGRELVQVSHPELAAARGAALLAAKATGHLQGFDEIASLVPESAAYRPRSAGRERYDSRVPLLHVRLSQQTAGCSRG